MSLHANCLLFPIWAANLQERMHHLRDVEMSDPSWLHFGGDPRIPPTSTFLTTPPLQRVLSTAWSIYLLCCHQISANEFDSSKDGWHAQGASPFCGLEVCASFLFDTPRGFPNQKQCGHHRNWQNPQLPVDSQTNVTDSLENEKQQPCTAHHHQQQHARGVNFENLDWQLCLRHCP